MMSNQLPDTLAEELTGGLRFALGSDLVAVYLYGSAVVGGFVTDVSDIDLLVVTQRDLDAAVAERLEAFHSEFVGRHPDWDDRLELVYVGQDTLAHFRAGGGLGVISPGEPFHLRDGVELWIGNFYLVRETGRTLVGPPPADTIPSVSWTDFLTDIRRYADEVRSRNLRNATPGNRAYCVLTMCRALATIRNDRPCSKQEGAALVRSWMPKWAWLIDEAERCRLSRGRLDLADDRVTEAAASFVALVGDAILTIGQDMLSSPPRSTHQMEFTALLAPMNQVDQQIDDLRHLDPAAGSGLPAHVTLLYPFGPVDQIDTEVVSRLRALFGAHRPFTVEFRYIRWFGDDVLWLAPEDPGPFVAMTEAVVAAYPQWQPYGGAFETIIPHLTVDSTEAADGLASVGELRAAEAALLGRLPLRDTADRVLLMVGTREPRSWRVLEEFRLGQSVSGS